MSEIIKLFLGADEGGADFPELEQMRKEALALGYLGFREWVTVREKKINFREKMVVVRGAYTDICVARVVALALEGGAQKVEVDLPNCRDNEGVPGTKNNLLFNLDIKHRGDSRVTFTGG